MCPQQQKQKYLKIEHGMSVKPELDCVKNLPEMASLQCGLERASLICMTL